MPVARYDTDAMRDHAQRLRIASDTLHGLAGDLARLADASMPDPVDHAVGDLGRRGRDMIGDLADGASELASGLGQAADRYDQLDQSLIRSLSGS